MNLLDEAISEAKFERNIKIFKTTLYFAAIFGALLIIYSLISNYFHNKSVEYNRAITIDILHNSVDLSKLKKDVNINYVAKLKYISNFLSTFKPQEYVDSKTNSNSQFANKIEEKFQINVINHLENLQNSNDLFIKIVAYDYMGKLILDHPEYFTKKYAEKFIHTIDEIINKVNLDDKNSSENLNKFNKISNLILIKALWLKNYDAANFLTFYEKIKNLYNLNSQTQDNKSKNLTIESGKLTVEENEMQNIITLDNLKFDSIMLILDLIANKKIKL